jgi:MinD superfamily P-loop ATPase
MPYRIAIASGKGGTGKTTVAVNLFHHMASHVTTNLQLVDCDVEEPNVHIFFQEETYTPLSAVTRLVPSIDTKKCTFCRKCSEYCEFNALTVIPPAGFAEVNPSLCHSCGACLIACEDGAITEKPEEIGMINRCELAQGGQLYEGRLKIGSTMQTMMIRELKKSLNGQSEMILYDAPPGTSCPVVETIADADFIILVAEPTPFGLYDLKLTVDLIRTLSKPFGVIINKAGLGSGDLYDYLEEEKIEKLGEIPFDMDYAGQYARGELITQRPETLTVAFIEIIDKLMRKVK